MTSIYSIGVTIAATVYVRAASPEEALRKAKTIENDELIVEGSEIISGLRLDDPNLPDVSISPAMTIGEVGGAVDLAEELAAEAEDPSPSP